MNKADTIRLHMLGLPIIQTIEDFSMITHLSGYTIYQLSIHSSKYYKTYRIAKKSGKRRIISQPSKKLKGLQAWILFNILNKLKVSNSCKGFEKGTSISDNVEPHKDATVILTLDLKDFFNTITSEQVYNVFQSIGYNSLISTVLTNICTYNNSLPQGGPCSPKLANLCTWQLDVRIQGFVGKRGINYTRYADDLTFSALSPSKVVKIIPMIKKIIEEENFFINDSKTRIAGASRAKIVTGLVISNGVYGVGKIKYKELRAKIHHLTYPSEQGNKDLLNEVQGLLSFIYSVDYKRYSKVIKYIKKLDSTYSNTLVSRLQLIT